jgi:hypothetical protein
MPRLFATTTAIAVAIAASALVARADARSVAPCWKLVQNDAYDRHIDGTYSVRCYREAIAHIPGDSLIYGELRQDVTNAMLGAMRSLHRRGVSVGPTTLLPGARKSSRAADHRGLFAAIAQKIGPGNASSLPLPLLVLGGLGLLLVASACTSFIARRVVARRRDESERT